MKDTFTSDGLDRWGQRYDQTIGFYQQEDKDPMVVQIIQISPKQLVFKDAQENQYTGFVDKGIEFNFIPVIRGWFPTKKGEAYFLSRHAARQWRRGISPANTKVVKMQGNRFTSVENEDYLKIMDMLFSSPVPYAKTAYPGATLSKHFHISTRDMHGNSNIYCYDRPIGKFTSQKEILLSTDLYLADLRELLPSVPMRISV